MLRYGTFSESGHPLSWASAGLRCVLRATLAVAGALCLAGCAHTPPGATQQGLRQMIVQFTVRGRIDLNKHYFIALDLTGDTSQGPIPVVQRPWGNGWGAGRITHYVQMDAAQPGYAGIYKFRPDSSLLAADYLGRPLAVSIPAGGNTVEVALDLDLLQGAIPVTQQLNLNLISTDIIPIDPAFPGPKLVDALGPGAGNGFITLNTQSSRIYRNSDSLEPEGADNADIDLDLVDWQIEVRNR